MTTNPLAEGLAWAIVAFIPVAAYLVAVLAGANPPWPYAVLMVLLHAPAFARAQWCFLVKARRTAVG
jgi:hypothetical protein